MYYVHSYVQVTTSCSTLFCFVQVVDITHESVVICLTGVPHYITDATITMLVSTFGIAIGEVERRFYKGVDTGERFVRLKPRPHIQMPDFVTVGGCKILVRILSHEETGVPYVLQTSSTSSDVPAPPPPPPPPLSSGQDLMQMSPPTSAAVAGGGATFTSFRAKPGHCNGTLNSSTTSQDSTFSSLLSNVRMSLPIGGGSSKLSTCTEEVSDSDLLMTSPRIGKSFCSRIKSSPPQLTHGGGGGVGIDEVDQDLPAPSDTSYVAGDPVDLPTLSPPPYKANSTSGGSTSSVCGTGSGGGTK